MTTESDVKKLAAALEPETLRFARQLVRTKSLTAHEGDLAKLVARKMSDLDYDDVSTDSLGNVIGVIGHGPRTILFDAHMDTVDVKQPSDWRYDPFGGDVVDGKLYGRARWT